MKRPLLLMFVCFVLGEMSIMLSEWWVATALGIVWVFVLILRMKKSELDRKWLFAPLFFLMGTVVCYDYAAPRAMDAVIQESVENAIAKGQVYQWEETTNGVRIYLKEVQYQFVYEQNRYSGQLKHGLLVYAENYTGTLGQWIKIDGTFAQLERVSNPGSFNSYQYWKARNIDYQFYAEEVSLLEGDCWQYQQKLREVRELFANRLKELFPSRYQGILSAMIVGDKADLDKDVKTIYQKAGIAHIIAISGLHVGLVGVALFRFLRKCRIGYIPAAVVSGSLVISYALLTGMSGSTKRAMIMLLVSFFGQVLGKSYDLLTAMAFAGFWILMDAPFMLMDAGFLLSFGAIAGIGLVYPALAKGYEVWDNGEHFQGRLWKKLRQSVMVSISIQLATLPVIVSFYYEFPLYSACLNLLVIPLMSVLIPVAVLAVLLSYLWMPLAGVLVTVAKWILLFYETISEGSLRLPAATILTRQPKWWQIVIYYMALIIVLFAVRKKQYAPIWLACSLVLASMQLPPRVPLEITMLDVGQGDGLVIRTSSSKTILMDGGSSSEEKLCEYTYLPYLKSQRITKIDMVIVSHSDKDHISAIEELIPQWEIGMLCLPAIGNPNDNYKKLETLAKEYEITVKYLAAGMHFTIDDIVFECVFPVQGTSMEDVNAASTTIYLHYKEFTMLFTGDLTAETENAATDALVQNNKNRISVLKVAHHGSKYSTSQSFLDAFKVECAIISVGKNNRYGHPHADVLNRLYNEGANIFVTTQSGAIIMKTDGETIEVTEYKKQ